MPSENSLKKTALADTHVKWGARMVEFGGWWMPVQYSGIIDEHQTVRTAAGLFDISHMGEVVIEGPAAADWLNTMLTNDVSKLGVSEGQYTLMLNPSGGVIDDLIIYRTGANAFFLVINASKIDEDVAWLKGNLPSSGVTLVHRSDETGALALQGPKSPAVLSAFLGSSDLPSRNHIASFSWNGHTVQVARTGYTGEDGFELFFSTDISTEVWEGLLKAGQPLGLKPAGLGARDTLRLEACYPLNGNDLSSARTPIEAGLGLFVSLDKKARFPGHDILLHQKQQGTAQRLAAFRMESKSAPPRSHYLVYSGDRKIGEVTSGGQSPTLGCGIGLAYIDSNLAQPGQKIEIEIRGQRFPAVIVKKPFYKKP